MQDQGLTNKQFLLIITGVIFATGTSLTSNLTYFNIYKVDLFGFDFIFSTSAITWPLAFAVLDMIAAKMNKYTAIYISIMISIVDGYFSTVPMLPHIFIEHNYCPGANMNPYINYMYNLAPKIFELWWFGMIATIITSIAEILLFSFLIKNLFKSVALSIIVSTAITLAFHNIILDFIMVGNMRFILGNYIINVIVVTIYALIVSYIIKKNFMKETVKII